MINDKNESADKSESEPSSSKDFENNSVAETQINSIQPPHVEGKEQKSDIANNENQELIFTAAEDTGQDKETLQPSTSNMEVHHHPHVHHSTKWKNYLYEFLMLFLAVTAGFFVENQREHYIEHQRVKQFSRHLFADLRLDSMLFENRNAAITNMQQGYDSLLYLLTQKTNATNKEILEVLLPLTFVFDIPATTTTYDQMKTSGSLRYIQAPELTAHLQQYYDVLLPRSIKIAEASLSYFSENINPFYLKHIRIQDYDPFNDTLINKNPVIMEHSVQTNQELANIMGGYRSLLKIQTVSMNEPALKKIKETMELLKKEYGLK